MKVYAVIDGEEITGHEPHSVVLLGSEDLILQEINFYLTVMYADQKVALRIEDNLVTLVDASGSIVVFSIDKRRTKEVKVIY